MTDSMPPVSAPEASPNQAQSGGVRRVNNVPVYLIGVAVAIFLGIMALVAMDRSNTKQTGADTVKRNGNTALFAKELAGDRKDGIIAASYSAPPEEFDFRPGNPNLPLAPPQTLPSPQHLADIERIRQLKQQQFEEGVKAKTSVPLPQIQNRVMPDAARSAAPPHTDPIEGYKQRLAQVRKAGLGGDAGEAEMRARKGRRGGDRKIPGTILQRLQGGTERTGGGSIHARRRRARPMSCKPLL